jgi:phosphate/sulfate permease
MGYTILAWVFSLVGSFALSYSMFTLVDSLL